MTQIHSYTLTVLPKQDSILDITTCKDKPYTWRGHTYTKAGMYCDTATSINGCDSIIYLKLSIEDCGCDTSYIITDTTFEFSYLQSHPLYWRGYNYNMPGVYDTPLGQNISGCDSIARLILRVTYTDSVKVCKSHPESPTYSTPWGDYVIPQDCGCLNGCIIQTADFECLVEANLCIKYLYCDCDTAYSYSYQQIEKEEVPDFEWNGMKLPNTWMEAPRDTSFIYQTIKADDTCDSIATLRLHVIEPCEIKSTILPIIWNKK